MNQREIVYLIEDFLARNRAHVTSPIIAQAAKLILDNIEPGYCAECEIDDYHDSIRFYQ